MKTFILKIFEMSNFFFNYFTLKRKHVSYETFPTINGRLKIHGDGQIYLGKNVKINSSESSNPIGGMIYTVLSVSPGATLKIGNNVGISNSAIVVHKSVTIEDNVKIGGSVKIYDTDFHSIDYQKRVDQQTDIGKCSVIVIKNGAFIGAHSIILKGVTLGDHSIVGAGSVVTKSIPNAEIWAGNPAKFIRKLL